MRPVRCEGGWAAGSLLPEADCPRNHGVAGAMGPAPRAPCSDTLHPQTLCAPWGALQGHALAAHAARGRSAGGRLAAGGGYRLRAADASASFQSATPRAFAVTITSGSVRRTLPNMLPWQQCMQRKRSGGAAAQSRSSQQRLANPPLTGKNIARQQCTGVATGPPQEGIANSQHNSVMGLDCGQRVVGGAERVGHNKGARPNAAAMQTAPQPVAVRTPAMQTTRAAVQQRSSGCHSPSGTPCSGKNGSRYCEPSPAPSRLQGVGHHRAPGSSRRRCWRAPRCCLQRQHSARVGRRHPGFSVRNSDTPETPHLEHGRSTMPQVGRCTRKLKTGPSAVVIIVRACGWGGATPAAAAVELGSRARQAPILCRQGCALAVDAGRLEDVVCAHRQQRGDGTPLRAARGGFVIASRVEANTQQLCPGGARSCASTRLHAQGRDAQHAPPTMARRALRRATTGRSGSGTATR